MQIKLQPSKPEIKIIADPGRVQQILINLINNAIKYGYANTTIHIQTIIVDKHVRISVKDQGPGLTSQQQSELFIPFNRLGADHSEIKGTGIGLALSKQLVELMAGKVGVDCQLDQGCTFWFTLPLAK
ncbi:MAG: ATP-binding protein [Gammaproteobacteria bacterium]|nr:ATP-binding protein [Gammaproteobacteria bacterium]